jgi:Fur family ferric uptake transcriptional regulator
MEPARPSNYSTRQGDLITGYFSSLGDRHVTVNEIADHFGRKGLTVGRTTIYRHLEKLVNAGVIRKYIPDEGESACYQYIRDAGVCREHFHLKCEKCGALIHLECDMLNKIARHILKEHRFRINLLKTIFYGRCENCLAGDDA